MEWVYPKRRGPQWKQGWTGKIMASVSAPPLHLLTILSIVVTLLWLSQYKDYKAQLHNAAINFQLFLFLFPLMLMLFMFSYSMVGTGTGRLNFHITGSQSRHQPLQRHVGMSP